MNLTREYLSDPLSEIEKAEKFSSVGKEAFYKDDRTQYALMMAYARIGEIAKRIPNDVLARHPEAEWKDVKGFRDVLLHRYDEINPDRIWLAIQKLPTLKAAVEALLKDFPAE